MDDDQDPRIEDEAQALNAAGLPDEASRLLAEKFVKINEWMRSQEHLRASCLELVSKSLQEAREARRKTNE